MKIRKLGSIDVENFKGSLDALDCFAKLKEEILEAVPAFSDAMKMRNVLVNWRLLTSMSKSHRYHA